MIKLPQKSHFKMDEACGLTGVKPYILRFWESEFDDISPITSSSGQKLFSYDDVEKILLLKRLLYEDKLTIEQTKAKLLLSRAQEAHSPLDSPGATNTEEAQEIEVQFDLEKLTMAKKQLLTALELTESLKSRYQWT